MTPEQYARNHYPEATDDMIKFFLLGYNHSLIENDLETLWDNASTFDKQCLVDDWLDDVESDGYDNIDDAWQDLNETEMMSFLKDKIQSLSIYELYQIMHNRIEELINEHQLMTLF